MYEGSLLSPTSTLTLTKDEFEFEFFILIRVYAKYDSHFTFHVSGKLVGKVYARNVSFVSRFMFHENPNYAIIYLLYKRDTYK